MARILIVEDNPANMRLACLLVERVGHLALCAVDGETGLKMAIAEHPDLILMDIQLPGIDGLAVTALLKSDPLTASIPIIALTALATQDDERRTKEAGCDAYLSKPIRHSEFYALLNGLLGVPTP